MYYETSVNIVILNMTMWLWRNKVIDVTAYIIFQSEIIYAFYFMKSFDFLKASMRDSWEIQKTCQISKKSNHLN